MTPASIYTKLLEEWDDLLRRRPTFREPLAGYRPILEAWASWPTGAAPPLEWDATESRARWERGVPLLAEAGPVLDAADVETLLAPALELVLTACPEDPSVRRFAEAWDHGAVRPSDLVPSGGGIGSGAVREALGLSSEVFGFLACAGLRPPLENLLTPARAHFTEDLWSLGVCPFCGGPPGFTDLLENGGRRLACHLCGSVWLFPRLRCPFCGSTKSEHFMKLQGEGPDEGYLISGCKNCNAYLKELDRRVRWNGGLALVEDWGSPHLDLVARRAGYWRAVPTLMDLQQARTSPPPRP